MVSGPQKGAKRCIEGLLIKNDPYVSTWTSLRAVLGTDMW